ncbi:MAG: cyclophilin-like fold protein [Candidatus Thorarchaeota archaeon]
MSEIDLPIELEFEGGTLLNAVLERVRAPLIIEEMKSKLPIEGRAALMRAEMQITLGIGKGNIKPTKEVARGDIAYMPLGDNLCVYLDDMTTFSPVTVLGRITSDEETLDMLRKIRRGSRVEIRILAS